MCACVKLQKGVVKLIAVAAVAETGAAAAAVMKELARAQVLFCFDMFTNSPVKSLLLLPLLLLIYVTRYAYATSDCLRS